MIRRFFTARAFGYGAIFSVGSAYASWMHHDAARVVGALVTAVVLVLIAIIIDLHDERRP